MKNGNKKDISASVRAKLLNISRSTGRDFQELTMRYTVERFLERLSHSDYNDRFILKGAMLYIPWKLDEKRTTMDLDLLGYGNSDIENLKTVFQLILTTKVADDGLEFDEKSIAVAPIREDAVYDGVRVHARVQLDSMIIRLQVDVGFGDQITPEPQEIEFPALLNENGVHIKAYSPETVIAEKFNAMVVLGMANSRMKDYFDIWMLSQNFMISFEILREAIIKTFSKRETELPLMIPVALSEEFFENHSKQNQWKGFIRKQRKINNAPELSEVIEILRDFLLPVVLESHNNDITISTWKADCGWG